MSASKRFLNYENSTDQTICIEKWCVREGSAIGGSKWKTNYLFEYSVWDTFRKAFGRRMSYKCQKTGIVVITLLRREGDIIKSGEPVLKYVYCDHRSKTEANLCLVCGDFVEEPRPSTSSALEGLVDLASVLWKGFNGALTDPCMTRQRDEQWDGTGHHPSCDYYKSPQN